MQLLEQINEKTSSGYIKGFLFSNNITETELLAWLKRHSTKWEETPEQYEKLGQKLINISKVARRELTIFAGEVGQKLVKSPNENPPENILDDAEEWFNKGNKLYDQGDFLGAIAAYDHAIAIKPDFYEAWNNKSLALNYL